MTTTNALMKEDLSICQKSLKVAQEENLQLKARLSRCVEYDPKGSSSESSSIDSSSEVYISSSVEIVCLKLDKKKWQEKKNLLKFLIKLQASKGTSDSTDGGGGSSGTGGRSSYRKHEDLEKELKLQMSMKAEMEMAMKLLEKDVHEKQETINSLRDQLEDIKHINLEMYTKLQVCLFNMSVLSWEVLSNCCLVEM